MERLLHSRISLTVLLVSSLTLFSACSTTNVPTPNIITHGGLSTFTVTEDTETSLIKIPGSVQQFCAARESDAISAPQSGLSLGFGMGGTKESVGATSSSGALSLGGRDPLVLIIREFMYRVCELSLNHNLTKEETLELYKYFMDKLIVIAPLTKSDGAASQSITPTSPVKESSSYDSKYDTKDDYYKDKSGF
ncbi:MAG: hypothetical protein KBE05_08880 [Sulfurospirillum sp.]|nr:hypothetical protein [Sulfurospirillum sp.]